MPRPMASESETERTLGGHLNIRSTVAKSEHWPHLLPNSNVDFLLCISETWLHQSSSQCIYHAWCQCLRRDRSSGRTIALELLMFNSANGVEFAGAKGNLLIWKNRNTLLRKEPFRESKLKMIMPLLLLLIATSY